VIALLVDMKFYGHQNSGNVDVIVMVLENGFLCCRFRMCHCNCSHR